MDITEALDVLEFFVKRYEYLSGFNLKEGKYKDIYDDYIATKTLIEEYKNLRKEVTNLGLESVKREKVLSELELEILYIERLITKKYPRSIIDCIVGLKQCAKNADYAQIEGLLTWSSAYLKDYAVIKGEL